MSKFTNPQISQQRSNMGLISLLKRSTCISVGKSSVRILRKSENKALVAWSAICRFVFKKNQFVTEKSLSIYIRLLLPVLRPYNETLDLLTFFLQRKLKLYSW